MCVALKFSVMFISKVLFTNYLDSNLWKLLNTSSLNLKDLQSAEAKENLFQFYELNQIGRSNNRPNNGRSIGILWFDHHNPQLGVRYNYSVTQASKEMKIARSTINRALDFRRSLLKDSRFEILALFNN